MVLNDTANELREQIEGKLHRHFGRTADKASELQMFKAVALTVRDRMVARAIDTKQKIWAQGERQVHYLSLEFLLGRSLEKNAFNLGLLDDLKSAVRALGSDPAEIFEKEQDAGLGNGGLGRLAACYLDSLTTLGIPATGYSICYHLGVFRQKILEGQQVEMEDQWLETGDAWLVSKMDEVFPVRFGGRVVETNEDGVIKYHLEDSTTVLAVPMDMYITGYNTDHMNKLRLWDAKSPEKVPVGGFGTDKYIKAMETRAMAEVIAAILYPEDNHFEGKLLRLRQQYFFVSATVQDIVKKHRERYGTLSNFHVKHVIHINDTHPTLVIPELMRIFLDEEGMTWDEAWAITRRAVYYTNHTVMPEALERWSQNIVEMLLPRIWTILCEINRRYLQMLSGFYPDDKARLETMAIIWDGQVRMANLCAYTCACVNGVSELHSKIIRKTIFSYEYQMWPSRFMNVTNGIDHRRWLAQVNPALHDLVRDVLGGDEYLTNPRALGELAKHAGERLVTARLAAIKQANKERLAAYIQKESGMKLNPDALMDVQVKRLHEYKRQLLNIMNLIRWYHALQDNPRMQFTPRTVIFGAKAASGYYMAKRIIRLIHSVADTVNNDPVTKGKLSIHFLENYRVSLAEILIPASELSEQISTAGKEASGTSNMKFMLNGALTIGTMDGANVEMCDAVGEENMFIFGLRNDEAEELRRSDYSPLSIYTNNPELRRVVDHISSGFRDGMSYQDITASLLLGGDHSQADEYLLLADFESYVKAQERVSAEYSDPVSWNSKSLKNIAASGRFAADRAIGQYAEHIWCI